MKKASEIMSKPVEVVRMRDSIQDVARLFNGKNISAAAVVDDQRQPIGVITKTDIARYQLEESGMKVLDKRHNNYVINEDSTVERYMTPALFTVPMDASLEEVAKQMVKYGTHHMFVRGKLGEPIVGIISSFDVLRHFPAARAATGIAAGAGR